MCSPRLFPIAPHFNLMCFAQSPPLLTYIAGPMGEALHLSLESSIWGTSIVSTFFVMSQSNWLIAKEKNKKVGLVRHPQLINIWNRTNKYPHYQGTLSACWAVSLAAWNFHSQNCLSPFSTWANNTPLINWGYSSHPLAAVGLTVSEVFGVGLQKN